MKKESAPAQAAERLSESTTSNCRWSCGADAAERGEATIHRLRSEVSVVAEVSGIESRYQVKRLQRQLEMERESYAAMEEVTKRKLMEQELR